MTMLASDPPGVRPSTRLWRCLGHGLVVGCIFFGFGATAESVGPRLIAVGLIASLALFLVVGPDHRVAQIILPIPVILYVAWMLLSISWTGDREGFVRDAQLYLPPIVVLTLVAGMLPLEQFKRALLLASYVTIAWTVVFTLLVPGDATLPVDGVPGWRGPFLHKNYLGLFMLFAMITIASFESRRPLRWIGFGVAIVFVAMSQSMTATIASITLLAFVPVLGKVLEVPRAYGGWVLAAGSVVGLMASVLLLMFLPAVISAFGKDLTLSSRTLVWERSLHVLADQPWVGFGMGGLWFDRTSEVTREIHRGLGFEIYHSHNGFLEVALSFGIVGLALYASVLVGLTRASLRIATSHRDLAGYCLLVVALIVMVSVTEISTFGVWVAVPCALYAVAVREGLRR